MASARKHTAIKFRGTIPKRPPASVSLPPLAYVHSPNQSTRLGVRPFLIVMHRPVGAYGPSISWLCDPRAQASAHWISEGNGTGVDVATQLVPWDMKAWACEAFNGISYNLEVDDDAWSGADWGAFYTAARVAAFLCARTGIPATSAESNPHNKHGIVRHAALGLAGGGHTDPTLDPNLFRYFLRQVQREVDRGGFRKTYGRGRLYKV